MTPHAYPHSVVSILGFQVLKTLAQHFVVMAFCTLAQTPAAHCVPHLKQELRALSKCINTSLLNETEDLVERCVTPQPVVEPGGGGCFLSVYFFPRKAPMKCH